MFLKKLRIHNYKSLRNVCFTPEPFAALIGPNASGKSNFADAVHFLSEVYEHGLETAIARKGGYENIAFRKKRRTTAPIEFEIILESVEGEPYWHEHSFDKSQFRVSHQFSIKATGTGIRSEFKVAQENYTISISLLGSNDQFIDAAQISRVSSMNYKVNAIEEGEVGEIVAGVVRDILPMYKSITQTEIGGDQRLILGSPLLPFPFISPFSSTLSSFKVYQFYPQSCRQSGSPTPNPKLGRAGENLPALIDWLLQKHPKEWENVKIVMQDILQGLNAISVEYLHTKTLGLAFDEDGFGRPWSAENVSDGTIQALAILAASADPRTSVLLIEEPENSVHPWIIRKLVERLKEASKTKNVIVTSQSPVLVDSLSPREVWIVARQNGETQIRQLTDLDPLIEDHWKAGKYQLSDFLDSGLVPQVVPGGIF